MTNPTRKKRKKDGPVSLHPLDPKEAVADLMKVKPEPKKKKKRGRRGVTPHDPREPEDR